MLAVFTYCLYNYDVLLSKLNTIPYHTNVLLVPRYKLSGLGRRAFRVAGPLVWNSIADCLRDPALELASFKRQLKPFLFAHYSTQRIERIRDAMTMRYMNLLFTYLLTYLLTCS